MVDHPTLIAKLATFKIQMAIIKWLVSLLSSRTQTTQFDFEQSNTSMINRSIVHLGSGIGPIRFFCQIFDPKVLDLHIALLKYADECEICC
jgi:hypothetical protein